MLWENKYYLDAINYLILLAKNRAVRIFYYVHNHKQDRVCKYTEPIIVYQSELSCVTSAIE